MQIIRRVVGAIVFIGMVSITLVTLAQFGTRHLSIEFPGGGELALFFAAWLYFMGMAYATFSRSHIRGGLEELVKSDKIRFAMNVIANVALFVFSLIGLWLGVDMLATAIRYGYVTVYYQMPAAFSIIALVIGFFLNALVLGVRGVDWARGRGHQPG